MLLETFRDLHMKVPIILQSVSSMRAAMSLTPVTKHSNSSCSDGSAVRAESRRTPFHTKNQGQTDIQVGRWATGGMAGRGAAALPHGHSSRSLLRGGMVPLYRLDLYSYTLGTRANCASTLATS